MMNTPMTANVPATKNPDYYPHSGTAVAVRYWADRLNWLAVVDTLMPWDPCRARSTWLGRLFIVQKTRKRPLSGACSPSTDIGIPWFPRRLPTKFPSSAIPGEIHRLKESFFGLYHCVNAAEARSYFQTWE